MTTTRPAPEEITGLAEDLGLGAASDPAGTVVAFCRQRVDRMVLDAGGVSTIEELEALVTRNLQMVFEEVWAEADFDRIKAKYGSARSDAIFAALRVYLDDPKNPSLGLLVRRRAAAPDAPDRYVAVIDCRGDGAARRFFTRWHEIAHRLTTTDDLTEPVRRSERCPVEQLMDEIAGNLGFYAPIFEPAFRWATRDATNLSFAAVRAVARHSFPQASFQATLFACARTMPTPVTYLEAALGHKVSVRRDLADDSPRLFDLGEPPPGELRAVRVVPNAPAVQERLLIPTNMRVPEASCIHSLFCGEVERDRQSREDLGMWSDSRGKRLRRRAVTVEARRVTGRVIAIVQPAEPLPPDQTGGGQTKPLFYG